MQSMSIVLQIFAVKEKPIDLILFNDINTWVPKLLQAEASPYFYKPTRKELFVRYLEVILNSIVDEEFSSSLQNSNGKYLIYSRYFKLYDLLC